MKNTMNIFITILVMLVGAMNAKAGMYQMTDGNIVEIRTTSGEDYSYPDLFPISQYLWLNFDDADLHQANLFGTTLLEMSLIRVDLSEAIMIQTDLTGTNLTGANMYGANMYGTKLVWVNLSDVDMTGVDLSWADMYEANISHTNFAGANLTQVNFLGTTGSAYYDTKTIFDPWFNPVAAGWTLVPEPATMSLLALGSFTILARRRRKK